MSPYGTFEENFEKVVKAIKELKETAKERFISGTDLKKYLMEKSGLSKPIIIHYVPLLEVSKLIRKVGYNVYDLYPEFGDVGLIKEEPASTQQVEKKEVSQ